MFLFFSRKSSFLLWLAVLLMSALNAGELIAQPGPNKTDAQGRKQGEWKKVYPNGNTAYEGQFQNDVPTGTFRHYYEEGALSAEVKHSAPVSRAVLYHPNGEVMARGRYLNQKRDSLWQTFDERGQLTAETHYKNGEKHGTERVYYPDGSLTELKTYNEGVEDGAWEQYFPNGNKRLQATVINGVTYEGEYAEYFENGSPKIKGKYEFGKKEGSWLHYLENGALEVIYVYRADRLAEEHPQNGTFTSYWPNDIPRSEYTYKNGKKHGEFKEWYNQGEWVEQEVQERSEMDMPTRRVQKLVNTQVRKEGKYVNGELTGEVIWYTPDGKVEKKEQFSAQN